jgi:hypothetical protein
VLPDGARRQDGRRRLAYRPHGQGLAIYKARVGGVGHTFSASPIATRDRIYFGDEDGVTIVIAAGDEYREIAQNDLGEMMLASPAVAGNALFIRTEQRLYRIQQ